MSGEESPFDISEFIDAQKWILASMGVFAAISLRLQNWPGENAQDLVSIGVVASIFLFGFMAYLLTKNLQKELGGLWNTLKFLTSFQLTSIELVVFLILFYLLAGVVISFSTQYRIGIITVAKIVLFLTGISVFYFGMSVGSRVSESGGKVVGLLLTALAVGIVERGGFHVPMELIDMSFYVIKTASPDVFWLVFSAGLLVLPVVVFAFLALSIALLPLELLRLAEQD